MEQMFSLRKGEREMRDKRGKALKCRMMAQIMKTFSLRRTKKFILLVCHHFAISLSHFYTNRKFEAREKCFSNDDGEVHSGGNFHRKHRHLKAKLNRSSY